MAPVVEIQSSEACSLDMVVTGAWPVALPGRVGKVPGGSTPMLDQMMDSARRGARVPLVLSEVTLKMVVAQVGALLVQEKPG